MMAMWLRILFFISPLLAGLYHELACGVFSVCLVVWLFVRGRQRMLSLRKNAAVLAVACFFLAYLITPLWAVDSGLAAWGIAKALPVLLFPVCLMQLEQAERRVMLCDLPLMGCIMTAASCLLQMLPPLSAYFVVNGRLGGFFQYPNTFACFLLLGLEVLLFDQRRGKWTKLIQATLLALGFFQAGSRAMAVIALFALAAGLLLRRHRGDALLLLAALAGGCLLSGCITGLTARAPLAHMLDISANASTLLGRLLYWRDALPVIARHPFGLGHLGYYFMQGSFQTGVYSVRWVHNDLLQLLLDVGWLPAIVCLLAIWRALRSQRIQPWQKLVLLTLLTHAFCDFDLQYVSMFLILLLTLDWDAGKPTALRTKPVLAGLSAAMAAVSLWFGLSSALTTLGQDAAAVRLYPWNTFSQLQLLTEDTDMAMFTRRSSQILRQNPYCAVAWNAQAVTAQQQGDYSAVVYAKRKAIACNRYELAEYTDYLDQLLTGAQQYTETGQSENAALCIEEARRIPAYLAELEAETSPLAWRIADRPQLELPQAYVDRLNALR